MGAALIGAHGGAFLMAVGLLWWREHGNGLVRLRMKASA